ncbi:Tll0287-like domain-containing protein [Robiginitalea aurantiaca]|uniref:DUF3365 domain-containing protein n=1 Tax=Robiginitalea aurantiaca TaxID=3056915 RepID=A0ABT7WE28_9FLAO|nr:DUF3365 domain-containing protein [Robiginitalea aurantiaca]MDM9631174.1 DUF3365 domain-containing protein [Robiginitalea aurantiaca]
MKYLLIPVFLLAVLLGCKDTQNQKQVLPSHSEASTGEKGNELNSADYQEKGMEYAMAVQGTLGKTLQSEIQKSGIKEAIVFCKVEALPITDSLSKKFGASISRISDKPRNPVNMAGAEEMKLISNYRTELSQGQSPEGLVVRQDDRTNFYYPILTNNLCLKCHGAPGDDIRPDVLTILEEYYPQDQATGYSSNQLRGLWKVSFSEN